MGPWGCRSELRVHIIAVMAVVVLALSGLFAALSIAADEDDNESIIEVSALPESRNRAVTAAMLVIRISKRC